ncbi:MAG: hypothetical protein EHM24_17890 [Acidobacteria bacterium]|nr:MAG: hypothetical protein EHM24_17890 [Acidobacteriota bacterium]
MPSERDARTLRIRRPGAVRVLAASVAPFLILFAPFLGYAEYQHHGFQNADVAVFALILAGIALILGSAAARWPLVNVVVLAGLITFLVDIQARDPGLKRLGLLFIGLSLVLCVLRRHASRIVATAMLALVVALVLFPPRFEGATAVGPGAPAGREDLPLVVHVLLDELIGVEGLPADLTPRAFKEAMQAFFVERGFRLFGKAYSQYPMTIYSVPQFLNLAPAGYRDELVAPGPSDGTFRLTRNAYFERFARLGYAIKVHEPDYLYLCPDGLPASCRTYASRSLNVLDALDVPLRAKLSVVAGTYLVQSEVYSRTKNRYRAIRQHLAGVLPLPAWNWDLGIPTTASSMEMFEAVSEDLSKARAGTLVFAHILIPHSPYVYDGSCRPRPAKEWMERGDWDIGGGVVNVREGRSARYAAYLQQVACGQRQLARLLDSIPAPLRRDAVVIVQGDHGSRITMADPTTNARNAIGPSDVIDSYSTMFAVRSRWIPAGYDLEPASITCLLRSLVESDLHSTAGIAACSAPRFVYFLEDGKPSEAHHLPDFGTATATAAAAGPISATLRSWR